MTQESLVRQWLAWLDTVPNEFLFLMALPIVVAVAGLLRLALDRRPVPGARHDPSDAALAVAPPTRH